MRTSLKLCLGVLVLLTFKLNAQSDGYYAPIFYRDNDPFVFCTKGQDPQKNPDACWKPMPPYTGQFMMMPHCDPPNPYGQPWDNDDTVSFAQYQATCGRAGPDGGRWEGSGRPEMSPYRH